MSLIDDQIKELTRKKSKIEFLNHILISVKDYDGKDFDDVQEDVIKMVEDFVNAKTDEIVNGVKPQKVIKQTPADPMAPPQEAQTNPTKPHPAGNVGPSIQEQASFALENRHLSGKQVVATNEKGGEAQGEVVGLDCPNVVIKTTEGAYIKAPRSRIREI